MSTTKTKGAAAEQQAQRYLEKQGLKTIACNYYCHYGEIDLIMQDHESLVFVEVRSRTPQGYGDAVETISQSKINKIIKTAEHYLQEYNISIHTFCRFDVVTLDNKSGKSVINWLQNAFEVET